MTFRPPLRTRTVRTGLVAIAGLLMASTVSPAPASAKSLRPASNDGIGSAWTMRSRLVAKAKQPKSRPSAAAATSDELHACAAAYTKAQERTQAARLIEAKELLAACAPTSCGPFLHQECTTLHNQLEADIPSVIPSVTDDSGAARTLVEVNMDGQVLTSKLDGHPLSVDPGKHEFSFSTDAGVFAIRKIMIVQGQRNRPIAVKLRSGKKLAGGAVEAALVVPAKEAVPAAMPAAAASEAASAPVSAPEQASEAAPSDARVRVVSAAAEKHEGDSFGAEAAEAPSVERTHSFGGKTPVLSYVFAGTGVAALAGAGVLTFWGRKDNTSLTSCAPSCSTASLDHVHSLYLAADVAAGVGIASLVVSTWLYVRGHTMATEETAAPATATKAKEKHAALTALSFDVLPAPAGGAVATVGGAF